MPDRINLDRLYERFPGLTGLSAEHRGIVAAHTAFPELTTGAAAYREGAECPSYVMCLDGGTRTFKLSPQGRELLIYRVQPGGTCVFTTQCLIAGGRFPAESVAEAPTRMAALNGAAFHALMEGSAEFRRFVIDDYANLLASILALVDDVAFRSLEERLAQRLIGEADGTGSITRTHQQLAADLGSVREVISRQLAEWERSGVVRTARGRIEILDLPRLTQLSGRR